MKRIVVKFKEWQIAGEVILADSFFARARGLMGRKSFEGFDGMMIYPCNSIHTFFMHFPIDVIFLNGNYEVVKVLESLKPWRITAPYWGATQVLELAAGTIQGRLAKGDRLEVADV